MVTVKQKSVTNTQPIKRKEHKYTTKGSHQTMKEEGKKKGTELETQAVND